MTTITITDEQGQLMVAVDGGEPMPVENAAMACQVVEKAFGQPDADEAGDGEMPAEGGFEAGFRDVRGGGLNGAQA